MDLNFFYYDFIANLPSARLFLYKINKEFIYLKKMPRRGAVLYINLDNFKIANESLENAYYNRLIKEAVKRLKSCLNEDCTLYRLEEDEFAVLFSRIDYLSDVSRVANRIIDIFNEPWTVKEYRFYITVSIGISIYPDDGNTAKEIINNAYAAMIEVKKSGKNNYMLFRESINQKNSYQAELEKGLRKAAQKMDFNVYYQPLIDVDSMKVVCFEALLRWIEPQRGNIPPDVFIPVAEETGLIIPIGEWIIGTVCKQIRKWNDNGYNKCCVSINISPLQLKQDNFAEMVIDTIYKNGIEPKAIEFEITEGKLIECMDYAVDVLTKLSRYGIKISLDDFGKGYSSLTYLKSLPIDRVKIDKSFIENIENDMEKSITNTIITLGHRMNMEVIAEGVETCEQFRLLTQQGCDRVQGFLFSYPVPSNKVDQILNTKY